VEYPALRPLVSWSSDPPTLMRHTSAINTLLNMYARDANERALQREMREEDLRMDKPAGPEVINPLTNSQGPFPAAPVPQTMLGGGAPQAMPPAVVAPASPPPTTGMGIGQGWAWNGFTWVATYPPPPSGGIAW
jgi:hypothetical protein